MFHATALRFGTRPGWGWALALALVVALASQSVSASEPAAVGSPQWRSQMGEWLDGEVGRQLRDGRLPLRAEIEVGALDSRLQLAPCRRVEPYLPNGTRLWGRSRIGLRCTQGPVPWKVFLPIYVRVWGPGWVLRQPVAPGETLTAAHAEPTEVDWTASRDGVLARPEDWQGLEAVRGLAAGQVLRAGLVRAPQAFEAGTVVRLRVQGGGFTLTATGEALSDGRVGEPVRVRLPNRRVLVGTVIDAQTVDVAL